MDYLYGSESVHAATHGKVRPPYPCNSRGTASVRIKVINLVEYRDIDIVPTVVTVQVTITDFSGRVCILSTAYDLSLCPIGTIFNFWNRSNLL